MQNTPPLIAHIIHRLDYGGLENGLVNLINRIPPERYHHAIICMTDYTDFSNRITNSEVSLHALHKVEGKDPGIYLRLWKLLRRLKPDIVHTRNLSALEAAVVAWAAGVPGRVHGEHGRDSYDIDGTNRKYLLLRKLCQPFIQRYIPLSKDLEQWLKTLVHVPEKKIRQIYNGVDHERFSRENEKQGQLPFEDSVGSERFVVGTVGRIQEVKDQLTLVRAVATLLEQKPEYREMLRLVIVGDGPMVPKLKSLVKSQDIQNVTWLAGARNDIPELLQSMDLFVLPSIAEGISNTILEAMAISLPVVATNVGGNEELVIKDKTGDLVPSRSPELMAKAIDQYINDTELCVFHGRAGRDRVENEFSMDTMVNGYLAVYDELVG